MRSLMSATRMPTAPPVSARHFRSTWLHIDRFRRPGMRIAVPGPKLNGTPEMETCGQIARNKPPPTGKLFAQPEKTGATPGSSICPRVTPPMSLSGSQGGLNLHACSARWIRQPPNTVYDWRIDVMFDQHGAREKTDRGTDPLASSARRSAARSSARSAGMS
ncbi:hypothetical protein ACFJIW_21600 [Tahibacter sp. UC22_41]|uniref:hypothetical protein n=1 Tax=Tahibacter sp. UC22_41 TaxID=3350178 RepID=UPI0036D87852